MSIALDQRLTILKAIALGMPLRNVADLVELPVTRIKTEMRQDREFAAAMRNARAQCMHDRLEKLSKAEQWQAATFLLESLWPRRFGRNRKPLPKSVTPMNAADRAKLERLTEQEKRQLRFLVAKMNGRDSEPTTRDLPDRGVGGSPRPID